MSENETPSNPIRDDGARIREASERDHEQVVSADDLEPDGDDFAPRPHRGGWVEPEHMPDAAPERPGRQDPGRLSAPDDVPDTQDLPGSGVRQQNHDVPGRPDSPDTARSPDTANTPNSADTPHSADIPNTTDIPHSADIPNTTEIAQNPDLPAASDRPTGTGQPDGGTGPATGARQPPAPGRTDLVPSAGPFSARTPVTTRIPASSETGVMHEVPLFDDLAGTSMSTNFPTGMRLAPEPGTERPTWRPPLLVWVFTALFVSLMALCTFVYPAFSGYDEAFHVDMTYSYYNGNAFYAPGDRLLSVGVQKAESSIQVPPHTPLSDQKERPRGDRKSLGAYGGDAAGTYPVPNQMVQHPPLYYAVGAGVLRLFPNSANWPYDQWVAALRYLSILFMAPLPILAWAATKTLVGNGPAAVTAAALPLTIPNLARIGGSVNNDTLLILLTAVTVWLLAKVLAGDTRRGTGLAIGVVTGLACLTKGFALALPIIVIVAYGVAAARNRQRPWAALGIALLSAFLISGWWWIRNLALYGTLQPDGLGKVWSAKYWGPDKPGYHVGGFLQHFFPTLVDRTWGGIGLPEVPQFSTTICWIWMGLALFGMALGLGFGVRGRWGRGVAVIMLLPMLGYLTIVMIGSAQHYLANGVLADAQGRYLYPTITGVAVVVGIGWTRLFGRKLSGAVPLFVVLGALVTQVLAFRALVHVWWVPAGLTHDRPKQIQEAFRGILRWSPWDHVATTVPFVAVIGLSLIVLAGAIAYAARGHGNDEPYISDAAARATAANHGRRPVF